MTTMFALLLPILISIPARLLLSNLLKNDHQLSTPFTAYSRLQEGIYLFQHDIDPYSGGIVRHSPLYLAIMPVSTWLAHLIWIASDALGSYALISIWRARQGARKSLRRDVLIGLAYLLNPYVFLPSLALSTSALEGTLVLLAISFSAKGRASPALLALALEVHLCPTTVVLLLPILLLLTSTPASNLASPPSSLTPRTMTAMRSLLIEFALQFAVIFIAATLISGSTRWVSQTWGAAFQLQDLEPNIGLWWYFFTEMFDHFRPFFLVVFTIHIGIYVAPICIKFGHDPLYAAFVLTGIHAMFKPYPTWSDTGVFISMYALFPEIYPHLRHPIVTIFLHIHTSFLLPLFHHLWLDQGTANANFYYAAGLVYGLGCGAGILDAVYGGLRIAIGPEVEGWTVIQE